MGGKVETERENKKKLLPEAGVFERDTLAATLTFW
jgi:hypothetical protein